ncbi:MAG: IPT/TIG domain-containing protein [Actinomycetota bacterium]
MSSGFPPTSGELTVREPRALRWASAVVGAVLIQAALADGGQALAAAGPQTCGTSGSVQICMSVPSSALNGFVQVTASASSGSASVQFSWAPTSGHCVPGFSGTCHLAMQFGQNPGTTNDYSFAWPTQKYLDGAGSLQAQVGSGSVVALSGLSLTNGNATTIQRSPADWASFLPPPIWSGPTDPTVVAVGDGAVNQNAGNDVATSVAQAGPSLLLYLGDLYEDGTATETLNHYGWNAMDGPCPLFACSSLAPWGSLGAITQPTIGNHEYQASPANDGSAWVDYWHQRPLYTSFVFANALFIDLNCGPSGGSCDVGPSSGQFAYVSSLLGGPHPPCVLAYWHIPALSSDKVVNNLLPMWKLLTDGGGTLVMNGHVHSMQVSRPLNDQLALPTTGQPTMTEIISGAGGHGVGQAKPLSSRTLWTKGGTPGALYLTLNGAANGGTPTSISYRFEGTNHAVLTDSTGAPGSGTLPCTSVSPPLPTITGFSPTSGPIGTVVTITGSGFTGANDVRFNGVSVGTGNFAVSSDIQITATVPSAATTGLISVTTLGGTATSSSTFVVTSPQLPIITGFSPTSGPIGTVVTITGSGFTGAIVVKFAGVKATFTVNSDTTITATVPAKATTGKIVVKTPAGTASSPTKFTV